MVLPYEPLSSPTRANQQPVGEFVMGPLGLPVRRTYEIGNRAVQKAAHQQLHESLPGATALTQPVPSSSHAYHQPQSQRHNHQVAQTNAAVPPAVISSIGAFASIPIPQQSATRGRQLAALRGGLSSEQEERAARAKAEQAAILAQQIADNEVTLLGAFETQCSCAFNHLFTTG